MLEALADGFGGGEVKADGPSLAAFLVNSDGGFLAVLMEVGDSEATPSPEPRARVETKLQIG